MDLKINDIVIVGGDSGFCCADYEKKIISIDEEKNTCTLEDNHVFNTKTLKAITTPTAYRIKQVKNK